MTQLQDEDLIAIDNILRTCGTTAMSDKEIRWLNHTKESVSDISDQYRIAQKVITQRQKYQLCDYGVLDRVVELAKANGVMLIKQEPEKPKPVIPFIGGGASIFDSFDDDDNNASSGDYDGLAKAWAVGVTGDPTESAPSDTNNSLFYSEQSKIAAKNSDLSRQASEFSAGEAKGSETASAQSAQQSETSNQESGKSAAAAKTSEQNAKTSENNSNQNKLDSAESARQSEQSNQESGQHAEAAKTSETNSKASETEAGKSKNSASTSAQQSEQSNRAAKVEADKAKAEADKALTANILMSQAESDAIKSINNNHFAASGMVNMGKHRVKSGVTAVNEGIWTFPSDATYSNMFMMGRKQSDLAGTSKTDFPVVNIASSIVNISGVARANAAQYQNEIELPEAEAGTRTYNKATGESITHPDVATAFALAATSDDIEVVTHRVDLVGLEYYEEELTGTQEVFECIQSLSTTFGDTDVPTVLSTRKLSYFQQYDGQFPEVTADPDKINDRYRCVVWSNLTDEQKRKVAAYMGEKLFMGVNGHIVNGRLRARTIRGAGNGDWDNTKANTESTTSGGWLRYSQYNLVSPQGAKDKAPENDGNYPIYRPTVQGVLPHKGVFTGAVSATLPDTGAGYQGRCFMYVVATVPRANKGIYVKGLNEYGTAKCSDDKFWYESANKPTTLAECFIDQVGGDIASGKSGHPDGIFYDGIEAGGLNGVIDWRLGAVANDSPEEAAKVEAKVENGTYRGLEKRIATKVKLTEILTLGDRAWVEVDNSDGYIDVGSKLHSVRTTDSVITEHVVISAATSGNVIQVSPPLPSRNAGDQYYLVAQKETNLSVSGEFNAQMVIGDPANILLTDAIKDGWLGTWCPVIPDGTQLQFNFSRKSLDSSGGARKFTVDNGATWTGSGFTFDDVNNWYFTIYALGAVAIHYYKAFAKQTKPSTNKPVYNGDAGVMPVLVTNSHELIKGVLLSESVTGKIGKGSDYRIYRPLDYVMENGLVSDINTSMQALPADASEISAWQINNNWQSSIMFFDGANHAELAIPLGWIKNKAEAGSQFPKPATARARRFASYYGTSYN